MSENSAAGFPALSLASPSPASAVEQWRALSHRHLIKGTPLDLSLKLRLPSCFPEPFGWLGSGALGTVSAGQSTPVVHAGNPTCLPHCIQPAFRSRPTGCVEPRSGRPSFWHLFLLQNWGQALKHFCSFPSLPSSSFRTSRRLLSSPERVWEGCCRNAHGVTAQGASGLQIAVSSECRGRDRLRAQAITLGIPGKQPKTAPHPEQRVGPGPEPQRAGR